MTLLLAYAGLALGVSFLCSLLEAVLLSVTPSYIAGLQQEGRSSGTKLRALKSSIDRPLAAILSLNTIANTIGAAGVGAQAQVLWGSQALAFASAALTLGILVISEIIPKTVGAVYWRGLAPWAARILPMLIFALFPLVILAMRITRVLRRNSREHPEGVSRDELAAMAYMGREQGIFGESESRILRNLFRIGSLRVRDIMTPRPVVFSLPETTTVREVLERKDTIAFSRIPIWRENEDDVVGYVLKDDVLLQGAKDQLDRLMIELKRELLVVPESLPVANVFERLLDEREHIALAVDEYGGMAGVATMEDVVETLLGLEIVDEADTAEDMRAMARNRWYQRARRLGVLPSDVPDPLQEPAAATPLAESEGRDGRNKAQD